MRGAIPPLPQYAFMARCLIKHRDNFIPLPFTGGIYSVTINAHFVSGNIFFVLSHTTSFQEEQKTSMRGDMAMCGLNHRITAVINWYLDL
jgi:hypothetical protein